VTTASPASPGRLVLVATPIGNLADLSPRAVAALVEADVIACEDTRHSGRLLAHAGVRDKRLMSLHAHNEAERSTELVGLVRGGTNVAVISDAGTPLVSDPGGRLVVAAVEAGLEVSAVPGPSAVLAALVVSGLDTARWRFEGFLPRKGPLRRERMAEIAASSVPCVCFEAPHRLGATLSDLAVACGDERRVVLARELTKLHEELWRGCLVEAVERAAKIAPRGEHVVVVDGAPSSLEGPSGQELGELVARLLAAGLSRRDAAVAAEVVLGVSHREAYAAAHGPAGGSPGGA